MAVSRPPVRESGHFACALTRPSSSTQDVRSERELFIRPRRRSESIRFQRIPAERGASHPKFVLRRTIRARTVSCKELFPAHRRKQPSNQGFLELDVKCHDALFLSRFAKSVSPIIERAFAASCTRHKRSYVRRCMPFGFFGKSSSMLAVPPSRIRIPCAFHKPRSWADSCWLA